MNSCHKIWVNAFKYNAAIMDLFANALMYLFPSRDCVRLLVNTVGCMWNAGDWLVTVSCYNHLTNHGFHHLKLRGGLGNS